MRKLVFGNSFNLIVICKFGAVRGVRGLSGNL